MRMMDDKTRNKIAVKRILNSNYPFVYCPTCNKRILNDNGLISRHMRNEHIKDRANNADKPWAFHPTT